MTTTQKQANIRLLENIKDRAKLEYEKAVFNYIKEFSHFQIGDHVTVTDFKTEEIKKGCVIAAVSLNSDFSFSYIVTKKRGYKFVRVTVYPNSTISKD
jgi:predicted PP-loop superfamily ATPase